MWWRGTAEVLLVPAVFARNKPRLNTFHRVLMHPPLSRWRTAGAALSALSWVVVTLGLAIYVNLGASFVCAIREYHEERSRKRLTARITHQNEEIVVGNVEFELSLSAPNGAK